jgi:hypothetical protein
MARRPGILIAALLIAATVAPVPGIARDHGDYRDRDRHHGGGGATAAIIGGIVGLGLGAALYGSAPPSAYYPPPRGYYQPPPYYYPPPAVYYGSPY